MMNGNEMNGMNEQNKTNSNEEMNMMNEETEMDVEREVVTTGLSRILPHCPVMLVLDMSHSMWGRGLMDLKQSIPQFYGTLRNEIISEAKIDIASVSMGDNLKMLEDFTDLQSSILPSMNLRPKGDTPIGAALRLALEKIHTQTDFYHAQNIRYITPQLLILTDGKSTDDFTAEAEAIRTMSENKTLYCRAIALGESPDTEAIKLFAGENIVYHQYGMADAFENAGNEVSQCYEDEVEEKMSQTDDGHGVESFSENVEYLLDGSNILYWDTSEKQPSLKTLQTIVNGLKAQGAKYQVLFDASARHVLGRSGRGEEITYKQLLNDDPDHFQQVPAGTQADDFLLMLADSNPNMLILTQDLYRDHQEKYPWLKSSRRIMSGMVLRGTVYFPGLKLKFYQDGPENYGI